MAQLTRLSPNGTAMGLYGSFAGKTVSLVAGPPYDVQAAQTFVAGMTIGETFIAGRVAGQTFNAGAVIGDTDT